MFLWKLQNYFIAWKAFLKSFIPGAPVLQSLCTDTNPQLSIV